MAMGPDSTQLVAVAHPSLALAKRTVAARTAGAQDRAPRRMPRRGRRLRSLGTMTQQATGPGGPVSVQQESLFPIPIWIVDLSFLEPDLPALIADTECHLVDTPAAASPFRQTRPVLQDQEGEHWLRLVDALGSVGSTIVGQCYKSDANFQIGGVRCWGLEISSAADFTGPEAMLNLLHVHRRSLLSCVLWLRVPDGLVEDRRAGTMFRDPRASDTMDFEGYPIAYVPPAPLRLLVFPSFLEHAPAYPGDDAVFASPRLVIAGELVAR